MFACQVPQGHMELHTVLEMVNKSIREDMLNWAENFPHGTVLFMLVMLFSLSHPSSWSSANHVFFCCGVRVWNLEKVENTKH